MPAADDLKQVLIRPILSRLAGGRSFERGEEYFASGQVRSLVEHAGKLTATVQGTDDYQVVLSAESGALDYHCTCPVGEDGSFCKHCVAVGLAWLAGKAAASETPAKKKPAGDTPVVTLEDARGWLEKQSTKALVEMILDQATRDNHLRERLLLHSAKAAGKGVNVAAIRKAIERATRTGGFVHYRESYDFSRGIDQVVSSIEDLLKAGHASEVIELTEFALGKVEGAMLQMHDSSGYMGDILSRLQELHLAACREAKPDPEALAARLFDWEMRTHFDTFYGAAGTYADVLGERGLAAYRHCAAARWEQVPQVAPGQKDPEEFGQRYRITHVMETLARQTGDVEELVAIKARNLSSAYAFLQIAELYRDAKLHDQALDWAERGVKAFPTGHDQRLREFLAEEYHRRKRHDEAMQLVWRIFSEHTRLENYQLLKTHANRIGQWTEWREKALAEVRSQIADQKKQATRRPKGIWGWTADLPDHSLLVEIFLWEKDLDVAWHEARTGGCHHRLWMELARLREKDFPADAVPIYQKEVEALVNQKNNHSYAEAVKLLRKVRDLMGRLNQAEPFAQYLTTVRTAHKPKRNFIKLIERL